MTTETTPMPEPLGRRGNMVARRIRDSAGADLGVHWWFWCPGCDDLHAYTEVSGYWTRSGSDAAPSFSPSLLVTYGDADQRRCHLYLTNGQLRFLSDCTHDLAGKTVPLPEPPAWLATE